MQGETQKQTVNEKEAKMSNIKNSIHPDDDLHYEKMGLKRDTVELWEDGARVDGSKGTYE